MSQLFLDLFFIFQILGVLSLIKMAYVVFFLPHQLAKHIFKVEALRSHDFFSIIDFVFFSLLLSLFLCPFLTLENQINTDQYLNMANMLFGLSLTLLYTIFTKK